MNPGTLAAVSIRYTDASAHVSLCLKPALYDYMGAFLNPRGVYRRDQYAEHPARELTIKELRRLVSLHGSDPDFIIWSQT